MGKEGDHIQPYIATTRMSPALRWAASKLTWRLTSTKTIRLTRDGEKVGKGGVEVGGGGDEIIYQSLHSHHQNDSCIKIMGRVESHFNVS